MSDKMSKQEHKAKMAKLEALKAHVEAARDAFVAALDEGVDSIDLGEATNHLHDAVDRVDAAIRAQQGAWNTRNWTASDWSSWDLVTSNVD